MTQEHEQQQQGQPASPATEAKLAASPFPGGTPEPKQQGGPAAEERPFLLDEETGRRTYLDSQGIDGPQPDLKQPEQQRQEGSPGTRQEFPELPEPSFDLQVPEALTPSEQEAIAPVVEDAAAISAHTGMISPGEMQELVDIGAGVEKTLLPPGEYAPLDNPEACMTLLNSRYGHEGANELVALANAAVAKLGPRVKAWLDEPMNPAGDKLGNSPGVIYALAAWQRGVTRMSPEAALKELTELRKRPEYAACDRRFTDFAAILDKVAYRNPNAGPKPRAAAPAVPTREEELRAELKQIRSNRAYFDISMTPEKKRLMARVAEIDRELYG